MFVNRLNQKSLSICEKSTILAVFLVFLCHFSTKNAVLLFTKHGVFAYILYPLFRAIKRSHLFRRQRAGVHAASCNTGITVMFQPIFRPRIRAERKELRRQARRFIRRRRRRRRNHFPVEIQFNYGIRFIVRTY